MAAVNGPFQFSGKKPAEWGGGFCQILLIAIALIVVAGCDRIAAPFVATSTPSPTPAPDPGFVGVATPVPSPQATQAAAAERQTPAGTVPAVEEVSAPARINTDAEDAVNRAMRVEVLKRIDVMPNLGDAEKDKLYVQVERARAMGKVITIPFASGARTVAAPAVAGIAKALAQPELAKLSGDPTVVFVVLGYADKKGDPQANREISLQRAQAVVDVLKNKSGVDNLVHAVGMGGSVMFDSASLEKNRVVEVWAVLP